MSEGVALYIHIPFCKQKCLYCDFPSFVGKESLMMDYAKALSKDIGKVKSKVKTIFIGGGTPTYLSLEAWNIIKEALDKLDKEDNLEFTIEGNPGTFTKEKLMFFKNMGANRLSIGLQAFQNNILKSLGRIHTIEDFKNSYYMARECDFNNINVDLMFGIPEQSLDDLVDTLKNIISMNPEHISCYSLIIEEGTPFYNIRERLNLPTEDLERDMYEKTIEILKESGYYQYEISNFSKEGNQCRHNLVYWSLEDYIGCGSASHSYANGMRYSNESCIEKYIEKIQTCGSAVIESYKNTTKDDMEEFMFMGLRKIKGISEDEFKKRFQIDIYSIYGDIINKYKKLNLIIEEENIIFLSKKGIEISNVIMSDFMLD